MRKNLLIAGLLVIGSLIFVSASGLAESVRSGDNITVAKGETVDSVLFTAGRNIDIAGTVNGDVYCAGMNVSVSGTVNGDIFCAAQTLRVSGEVEGSVKLAGQTVNIDSPMLEKVGAVGQSLTIDSQTKVEQDALLAGQDISLNGPIGRDLAVAGQNVTLSSEVKRNINGDVENLRLTSDARVGGDIEFTSANDLDRQDRAEVNGEITRLQPEVNKDVNNAFMPIGVLYLLFAVTILALVLVLLFPGLFSATDSRIAINPGKTFLIGLAGIFLGPVLIGVLLATVVGIPLAILGILAWLVLLMLSGPTFAYSIGRKVWSKGQSQMLVMLVGALLLVVLSVLPIIGFFVVVLSGIFGLGALLSEMFGLQPPTPNSKKAAKKPKKS